MGEVWKVLWLLVFLEVQPLLLTVSGGGNIRPRDGQYPRDPIPGCRCLSFLPGERLRALSGKVCDSKKERLPANVLPGLPPPPALHKAVFLLHLSGAPLHPYFEVPVQNLHFWLSLKHLTLNLSKTEPSVPPSQSLPFPEQQKAHLS